MTDRELLDRAAKAAGLRRLGKDYCPKDGICVWNESGQGMRMWNPLLVYDDAMRLAVKLRMRVDMAQVAGAQCDRYPWFYEPWEPDPHAAIRRAIVCAAAELWHGIAQSEGQPGLPEDNYYKDNPYPDEGF